MDLPPLPFLIYCVSAAGICAYLASQKARAKVLLLIAGIIAGLVFGVLALVVLALLFLIRLSNERRASDEDERYLPEIETEPMNQSLARRLGLPILVAAAAFAVAVVGALLVSGSEDVDVVNTFVESQAGGFGSYFGDLQVIDLLRIVPLVFVLDLYIGDLPLGNLGDLDLIAPLGFAFGAGVVAAFNPCGFAMLPAYVGLYLGSDEETRKRAGLVRSFGSAILIGVAVTAGFVVLFGIAGTIIGLGARSLVADILPWLGLSIGVLLTLAGAWLLSGGELYSALAQQLANRFGDPGQANVKGYFLFGLSYGTASLSCTLPIFLSVIGTSFAVASIGTSLGQFVLYACGMGLVIMGLTLGMALFKGAFVGGFRRVMPYVHPIGTWMMIVAGAYIVFYWLSIGGVLG